MAFFEPIEGGKVLIRKAGVYTVCPLFTMDSLIYAKKGAGYIKLRPHESTSQKGTRWSKIETAVKWDTTIHKGELILRSSVALAA